MIVVVRHRALLFSALLLVGLVIPSSLQAALPSSPLVSGIVTEVFDDSTCKILLNSHEEFVRLLGIEDLHKMVLTDESDQGYREEIFKFIKYCLIYRHVYLEFDLQERDREGRLLAYIWLARPEDVSEAEVRAKMFNAILLREGYARVPVTPFNSRYSDLFTELEREAREAGRGIWGRTTREEAPSGQEDQREITVYITESGKKYHILGCKYLSKSSIPISLKEAKAKGYVPCNVCKPPE